jgi:lipid A ethanolaminephosphotransferase
MSSSFSTQRPWPLWLLAIITALWLTAVGNMAFWQSLNALPEVSGLRGVLFMFGFGTFVAAILTALLALLAWPWVFKPVAIFLLLSAASATHFMLAYSVVIDSSMLLNVLHTDVKEATDLMSIRFAVTMLAVGIAPAWWLWKRSITPQQPVRWLKRVTQNLATLMVALVVAALSLFLIFQDFASIMRNHKDVRYRINPLNSLYAVGRIVADAIPRVQQPMQAIGTDAKLGPSYTAQSRPPMLILVVGETARAANFSLGGYGRDTNPQLQALSKEGNLVWFGNVMSCGTNTQASVPCMFSHHGKDVHESKSGRFENLLDVLQHAGLAVVWLDNQSGCKGVCDRVPNTVTRDLTDPALCKDGECLDGIMLKQLASQLDALSPERRARGTVVVLHQMGSHGPAYYKRSPDNLKLFQPECTSNALQSCSREALVNAYDNTLRYTDRFLADAVAWLGAQPADTSLLYVSDHGESLGENNLYLHGLPYALAPKEQKHVPWVTWLSPALQKRLALSPACLNKQADQALTHDNLFHSVLGLMDVQTDVYQPALDAYRTCRTDSVK